MKSNFTPPANSLETIVARYCIAAGALLFLLLALLQSFPNLGAIKRRLDLSATAGQEQITLTTPSRETHTEIYYDSLPIDPR